MPQSSKIFFPNRALGYVSNHIPLQVRYIKNRKENLITTCVGKSFHTYGISHFTLLSVSGLHADDITCMASDTFHIYTSCDNVIYAWRRGTELKHVYRGHRKPVHLMLPFGPHLISIDEGSVLRIWDIKEEDVFLELTFSNETFKISAVMHPHTYINKILLGSEQGELQLWNVKTAKMIHSFKGWGSHVTCLTQAPALDVAGIGLANGKIIIHNLKYDETIMEFLQDWGFVTTISFRTDDVPIMATGSATGHIVFWNLQEKKVDSQLMLAHDGAVTGMKFLPTEPLLVTSSPDNTLKLWIFDMTDGGARLLRIREGHSSAPNFIRFHGANGHNLLSSATDSTLRIFNTRTETFNKSLGKASYNRKSSKRRGRIEEDPLKMPPIIQFTSETTREKEWDNIACLHLGLPTITTWSYDKLKMNDFKLFHERFRKNHKARDERISATCLCMTHCGNFIIVGYTTGYVDRFNIQSGIHRASYGNPTAHGSPVRGVATDSSNHVTLTTGNDAVVKFWDFKGNKVLTTVTLDESVSFLRTHHESSMIALALEDFSVHILDLDTRTIVRKFFGHSGQLTDATFSPDSRWLITSSMDCTIKIWNIPTAQLIDHFRMDSACTSLSMSPTGELLATAHVDYLGVFLWANKSLYTHITLKPLHETDEAPLIELPDCSREVEEEEEEDDEEEVPDFKSPEQLSDDLITLSNVANSRWQNLLNIDLIKRKNKPRAPPKVPQAAPFFLPTIPSLNFQFDLRDNMDVEAEGRLMKTNVFVDLTSFGKLLDATKDDFSLVVEKLKCMGPSMIDFEIKSLSPEGLGSVDVMLQFLKCIEYMFGTNRNFELAQAYLGVFIKAHGNVIANEKVLREYLPVIQERQNEMWQKLQGKLLYNLCVVQTLKTM